MQNSSANLKQMISEARLLFVRGSVVYGTVTEYTKDIDLVAVVDNKYSMFIYENGTNGIIRFVDNKLDYQILTESKFYNLLDNHDVMALEALVTPDCFVIKGDMEPFREYFKLDKWKLRQSFSRVASNSWVKCHKKLTVEKDYNAYIAKKSLFHALRILILGKHIAEDYKFVPVSLRDEDIDRLFREIMDTVPDWEILKSKFQEIYNRLHSDLVNACPRPLDVEVNTHRSDATRVDVNIREGAKDYIEHNKDVIDTNKLYSDINTVCRQFKYCVNNSENRNKLAVAVQKIFDDLYGGYYNLK